MSEGFSSSLHDHDETLSVRGAWQTEEHVLRKQTIYAGQRFGARNAGVSGMLV